MSSTQGGHSLGDLIELFWRYADLTNDLPPARDKSTKVKVRARTVTEDQGSFSEDFEDFDFEVFEVDEDEAFEMGLHLPEGNTSFSLYYDILSSFWCFGYFPEGDLGFEVMGSELDEVVHACCVILKNRIAYILEDSEACSEDFDYDYALHILNHDD